MNEAFEKHRFPCSSPKKIFIPRVSEENTGQQIAFQLKLEFDEGATRGITEGENV